MAERQGLGKSLKSQTKYGTTSKLMCSNESFIKHRLLHGETLQGIALKYGCTVSKSVHIRKVRWNSDLGQVALNLTAVVVLWDLTRLSCPFLSTWSLQIGPPSIFICEGQVGSYRTHTWVQIQEKTGKPQTTCGRLRVTH